MRPLGCGVHMLVRCLTIPTFLGVLLDVAPAQDNQNKGDNGDKDSKPTDLSFVLATKNGKRLFRLGR